ncbi:hypothetical protein N8261_04755 [Flavobacteriaceae bacterium]|nr:hypothetical protein [Flavobacteriaceae bacterium]|tara:strand:- start:680 stop:850 length:171 start_codon:yes stop_codon:yes gene_type:complete
MFRFKLYGSRRHNNPVKLQPRVINIPNPIKEPIVIKKPLEEIIFYLIEEPEDETIS